MAKPSARDRFTESHFANVHRIDPLHAARHLRLMDNRRPGARDLDQQRMQAMPLGIAEAGPHLAYYRQQPIRIPAANSSDPMPSPRARPLGGHQPTTASTDVILTGIFTQCRDRPET
jgi:hypothetical protein